MGQAGLFSGLIILVIANAITLLTSLSAVATNTRVGRGGAYFMASRSLGLEIGGSIGVPLFLAQAVSVAFYVIGFTQSLLPFFPDLNTQLWAFIDITLIFGVTLIGSGLAIKAQYFIFGVLILALISFFTGGSELTHLDANLTSNSAANSVPFWAVFAIFFPAVTGVMSGASMSGDLKNPSKSIPAGTIGAVIVTFIIYAFQMWWLSRNADRESLLGDPLIMNKISSFPALIYAGLWAATLSSALASLLAAPRTLQALAGDGILPRFLAKTSGKKQEPRVALIVSFAIAILCVLIGDLNAIAPIISMFFLATYGMLNFVSFLEKVVGNPSYRPTFRVHWSLSLLGALGCAWVMFLLNPLATIISIFAMAGLYFYLRQKRYQAAWGDIRSGFWFTLTRFGLLNFQGSSQHTRNWRPVILVLAGNPTARPRLIQFAHWMESKCGFLFICQILIGPWEKVSPRLAGAKQSIDTFIKNQGYSAASQVITAEGLDQGVTNLIEATGVGPISPNTVLMGWGEDDHKQDIYQHTVRRILLSKRNLIFYIGAEEEFIGRLDPHIDIWWRSKRNGILMATLAHLISSNQEWRKHKVRIFMVIDNEEGLETAQANMDAQLKEYRIDAETCVMTSEKPIRETIIETSKFSEITFLGINLEGGENDEKIYEEMGKTNENLKGNIFVTRSWEDFSA